MGAAAGPTLGSLRFSRTNSVSFFDVVGIAGVLEAVLWQVGGAKIAFRGQRVHPAKPDTQTFRCDVFGMTRSVQAFLVLLLAVQAVCMTENAKTIKERKKEKKEKWEWGRGAKENGKWR
jgi:hypothetical protein